MFIRNRFALACLLTAGLVVPAAADECVAPGQWAIPSEGKARAIASDRLFAQLSQRRAVLLGETHDDADDHRWQLHTIAGLHALHPQLALALEMLPHRAQPILDQWVAGELTEEQFLTRTQWRTVWGHDAGLYMPIFQFARLHRVRMIALNIDRNLSRKVNEQGWAAIASSEREGVSDPAPASPAYNDMLFESFKQHGRQAARTDPAFKRFVDGMLLWDRTMAQGIAEATAREPGTLVVGLMGLGHLQNRDGVPRQLADLGVTDASVLLPWDSTQGCADLTPTLADALFGIQPRSPAPDRPRLGVMLEPSDKGARVAKITEGSIAQSSGLREGDIIETIAGEQVGTVDDVIAAVSRQAPGTWLPISIRRDGQGLDIVARFPPRTRQ